MVDDEQPHVPTHDPELLGELACGGVPGGLTGVDHTARDVPRRFVRGLDEHDAACVVVQEDACGHALEGE
ncbi:hypothetical protein J2S48_000463 [Promicromonospora iranensis]|uniref:Uncharacterized protein n=1 Tax=Promicromonospora iranensis TaxID=1105144 RepID=A0ABU2CHZ0_9MICO|nr:hypothetical protein [Promicromonospora iranensis]MDR7380948.1 hypothetical protein [Promicromonospora iranensis]